MLTLEVVLIDIVVSIKALEFGWGSEFKLTFYFFPFFRHLFNFSNEYLNNRLTFRDLQPCLDKFELFMEYLFQLYIYHVIIYIHYHYERLV